MSAVFLFVISVFGLGLGPSVVAALTDLVFHSDAMLGRYFTELTRDCGSAMKNARGWLRYHATIAREKRRPNL